MKGLPSRAYNILFHTHTVSGITISAALFVIFFAGAVTLFKNEFYQWEDRSARIGITDQIDYEKVIWQLDSLKPGLAAAPEIRVAMPTKERPVYLFYAAVKDSAGSKYVSFRYNPVTNKAIEQYRGDDTATGETLYRLHFLDQLPVAGRYLAAFVSLFFAFAVITGLLIHWRNLVEKFYAFSFKRVRKQFWKNAHTVFGIIGLPFQLMYAITGVFYLLSILVLAPAVMVLFNGKQEEMIRLIYPQEAFHQHDKVLPVSENIPVAEGIHRIRAAYPKHTIAYIEILNLGRQNAMLGADIRDSKAFNRDGLIVMDLHTGGTKLEIRPGDKNYVQSVLKGVGQLHFATFGGWLLKVFYFVLAIFSCLVIISGVLIWKEARNKPKYTAAQKRFHHRVTMIYLSVCFALFPATAVLFSAEQLVGVGTGHATTVNTVFFLSWLVIFVFGCFLRTEVRVSRFNLWLGGALALLVPVANGVMSGDWVWKTVGRNPYVFGTDLCWLLAGLSAIGLCLFTGRGVSMKKGIE